MLERVDRATPYAAHTMTNHRQQGGLERIASLVGYDGQMESAFRICDLTPAAERLQRFLNLEVLSKDASDTSSHMIETRATVWYEGDPMKSGTSWTNTSQINLALHYASRIHTSGLTDDKGDLVSILISTPYAQATRDMRRAAAAMSPWEICKGKLDIMTIDGSRGSEFDVTITPYIVGVGGGFLWQTGRPIVAWTRSRLAAIDILPQGLCTKRAAKWRHFQTYGTMQKKNNATQTQKRHWSKLSEITFTPASDDQNRQSLFCPNCATAGHHPRNCRSQWTGGLLSDASNVPPQDDAHNGPVDLGNQGKVVSKNQTRTGTNA